MSITSWLMSLFLGITPLSNNGIATWYGNEFIGKHHAAHWHNETPIGAPEVVTDSYLGVAAPSNIPFGTKLLIIRKSTCMGHESPYDGAFVIATVIDRKKNHTIPHYYDLWPMTAKMLGFGPLSATADDGCVKVKVYILKGD